MGGRPITMGDHQLHSTMIRPSFSDHLRHGASPAPQGAGLAKSRPLNLRKPSRPYRKRQKRSGKNDPPSDLTMDATEIRRLSIPSALPKPRDLASPAPWAAHHDRRAFRKLIHSLKEVVGRKGVETLTSSRLWQRARCAVRPLQRPCRQCRGRHRDTLCIGSLCRASVRRRGRGSHPL